MLVGELAELPETREVADDGLHATETQLGRFCRKGLNLTVMNTAPPSTALGRGCVGAPVGQMQLLG